MNDEKEQQSGSAGTSSPVISLGGEVRYAPAEEPKPAPVETVTQSSEALLGGGVVTEEVAAPKKKEKEPEPALKELDPTRAAYPWYVVHTYSGFEQRVKLTLEERAKQQGLDYQLGNILVPQETVMELKKGQKKTSSRKYFPGYTLVQMDLDEGTWHLVKDTPKVTGFVGDARNPSPVSQAEMDVLLKQLEGGGLKPKPKVSFEEGDAVKVVDGPFADFNGTVDEVKQDKGKLRVLISIFGRNTPVELDFVQVEKI